MTLLLNNLWSIFGGLPMAIGWLIAALYMAITIIGLPYAWAHLKLAKLCLAPVGTIIVPTD